MSGAAANAFRSFVLAAACLAAAPVGADSDEAWLQRAALPDGMRPLLVLILDRSQATSADMAVTEDYDPARDYGAALPPGSACAADRVWVRRGTGALPDCSRQAGVELVPTRPDSGLQCAAARMALAEAGYFISARAAQWRASRDGGHWDAADADSDGALECRADRGTHGSSDGDWYAAEGAGVPWTRDSAQETVNQVGQEITRRNLSIQPTLIIRPGFPMRVMVNKDLVLRPYQPLFFQRAASE